MTFADDHSPAPGTGPDTARMSDPLSPSSFRVTLVGLTSAEAGDLEDALHRVVGPIPIEVRREPGPLGSFPLETIHAIVFTPASLMRATAGDIGAVRSATEPGTCRVYLLAAPGPAPRGSTRPLDQFIQRTPAHGVEELAGQIIAYFREADDLNRRSTRLALRDLTCLRAYTVLVFLWPCSYVFALLHILNAVAVATGRGPWPSVLASPYVVAPATFFGAFFIVHCVFVVVRNALFGLRIVKRIDAGLLIGVGVLGLAAAATARSIASMDRSAPRILTSAALAAGVYLFYMYARRVRAECTSLSALKAALADPDQRMDVLNAVGRQPFTPDAFAILGYRSKSVFISYMHGSEWSSATAALIHRWTTEHGFEVFLDQSSIPSGSLWRQYLLRTVSECGCFIAVLDGEAAVTDWVLAESAYAVLLRKRIGKPRILLIARNAKGLAELRQSALGILYLDLFQLPPELQFGAGILLAEEDGLSAERVLRAMEEIRPMCLL